MSDVDPEGADSINYYSSVQLPTDDYPAGIHQEQLGQEIAEGQDRARQIVSPLVLNCQADHHLQQQKV